MRNVCSVMRILLLLRMQNFQNLQIWQVSRELAPTICTKTSNFPKTEQFGLANQIHGSVISIFSNIVEGSGRNTKKIF